MVRKWCAGALVVMSTSAVAGGGSTAFVGNLSFKLIDLDLDDGVAAAYTLSPDTLGRPLSFVSALATVANDTEHASQGDANSALSAFMPLQAEALTGQSYAAASVEADKLVASGYFSGQGGLSTYSAGATTGDVGTGNPDRGWWTIDLTPNSLLMVSVEVSASAWAGNLSCEVGTEYNDFGVGCGPERATGYASMALSYQYSFPEQYQRLAVNYSYYDSVVAMVGVYSQYGAIVLPADGSEWYRPVLSVDPDQRLDKSGTLTAVFVNSSDLHQQAKLALSAAVYGDGTAPIPEASTASMCLLGLAAIGGVARQRRSVQAASV